MCHPRLHWYILRQETFIDVQKHCAYPSVYCPPAKTRITNLVALCDVIRCEVGITAVLRL